MTVAEWYARYQRDGRAWLPRRGREQRHWLVCFRDATRQRTAYAHCFAESATLHLYAPDTPIPVAPWRLAPDLHTCALQAMAEALPADLKARKKSEAHPNNGA